MGGEKDGKERKPGGRGSRKGERWERDDRREKTGVMLAGREVGSARRRVGQIEWQGAGVKRSRIKQGRVQGNDG